MKYSEGALIWSTANGSLHVTPDVFNLPVRRPCTYHALSRRIITLELYSYDINVLKALGLLVVLRGHL